MKTSVIFEYDEISRKWSPRVQGVISDIEARQAFSAVVLTCQTLDPELLNKTKVNFGESYTIIPAVKR